MPLNPIVLEKGILQLLREPSKTTKEAAGKLARAYFDYVSSATAGGTPAAFTGLERSAMEANLASSFHPNGSPSEAAGSLSRAVGAFWMSPPVVFGLGPVVSWAGATTLTATLVSSLSSPKTPAGVAAKKIASALDSATRLVMVGTPPSGPLPVV